MGVVFGFLCRAAVVAGIRTATIGNQLSTAAPAAAVAPDSAGSVVGGDVNTIMLVMPADAADCPRLSDDDGRRRQEQNKTMCTAVTNAAVDGDGRVGCGRKPRKRRNRRNNSRQLQLDYVIVDTAEPSSTTVIER